MSGNEVAEIHESDGKPILWTGVNPIQAISSHIGFVAALSLELSVSIITFETLVSHTRRHSVA